MGKIAAGAFLRGLRERAHLSLRAAARLVDADDKTIQAWEVGSKEPSAERLACYIQALGGPGGLVMDLLADRAATAEDGHQLADLWARGALPIRHDAEALRLTPAQLMVAVRQLSLDELTMLLIEIERAGRS